MGCAMSLDPKFAKNIQTQTSYYGYSNCYYMEGNIAISKNAEKVTIENDNGKKSIGDLEHWIEQVDCSNIDFVKIIKSTSLEVDEIKVLTFCFELFNYKKQVFNGAEDISDFFHACLGCRPTTGDLQEISDVIYFQREFEFENFCEFCDKLLSEEEKELDEEDKLKEAFRGLYDKEGTGFLTTDQMHKVIVEMSPKLSIKNSIIDEIERGSGRIEFDRFYDLIMYKNPKWNLNCESKSTKTCPSKFQPSIKKTDFFDIFAKIKESTGLEVNEIKVLKDCFDIFNDKKQDFHGVDDIINFFHKFLGFLPTKEELKEILDEIKEDASGEIEFDIFCQFCSKSLVDEEKLKEAFHALYEEGTTFITTEQMCTIIGELESNLTVEELDGIIGEIDDGSGMMDFDEFYKMITCQNTKHSLYQLKTMKTR